jgi:hypothetical protein
MVGPLRPPPLLRLTRMQLHCTYAICHRRRVVIARLALAFLVVGVAVNRVPLSAELGGRLRLPAARALVTALCVVSP